MPRKKKIPEGLRQYELTDYKIKEVDVRLRLQDGPVYYSTHPIENQRDAIEVFKDILKELDREWVIVVNLDTQLKPINFSVVSVGSINASLAPVQNILKSAILSNANQIMLIHNHPSGSISPSKEDDFITHRVLEACKLMEMQLVDHIIVGAVSGDYYSYYQEHREIFKDKDVDLSYLQR